MEEDHAATLKQLSGMGYKYLEGSFYGPSATDYQKLVTDLGLICVCGGSSMSQLKQDPGNYLKMAQDLNYQYLVCYYPWLTSNSEIDITTSYQAAENLNEIGRMARKEGLQFVWHPHSWEFVHRENGERPFDIIMQNTDPEMVSLQLDIYWVFKGGSNAMVEMDRYPGRTKMFHVKDMSKDEEQRIVCVGEGGVDFKPILEYAQKHRIKYWFVENEKDYSSIHCAASAAEYLKTIMP
jgi:sugar phosphate isomerase/epimerase